MSQVELANVSRKFKREEKKFYAVKNINLKIERGDFVSIAGPSGSGKSTLLNLMAGLLLPDEGEIFVEGKNISSANDKDSSLLRNKLIGYIPQGNGLLSNLTVLDNVRLPFYLGKNKGKAGKEAYQLLEKLGLEKLSGLYPASLSGGETKRVAIARSLINKPALLLADEPTSGLDAENSEQIVQLFKQIAQRGTTVIMVTHDSAAAKSTPVQYTMKDGILSIKTI